MKQAKHLKTQKDKKKNRYKEQQLISYRKQTYKMWVF